MKKGIKRLLAATAAAGMLFAALPAYAVSVDQVIDADEITEAPDTSDAINVSNIDIAEGGKFVITYTCECETSMALVLRDGEWGSWSQYNTPDSKYETDGVYYAEYGYDTVVSGWQGEDIADITYASAKTWGAWDDELKVNVSKEATVLSIDWVTDKAPETTDAPDTTEEPEVTAEPEPTEIPIISKIDINEVIDADDSTEAADMTDNIDVSHIGMADGGSIRITYSCETETSIALVLRDIEWNNWTQINTPDKTGTDGEAFYAEFSYDTIAREWLGEDVSDITYANVKTWGAWDGELGTNVSRTAGILSIEWIEVFEPEATAEPEPTEAPDTTEEPEVTAEPEPTEIPIISKVDINEVIDADDSTETADMTGNINISHTGIGERGRFRITYSCENETSIALVLRDSEWNGWTQYNTPDSKGMRNGLYYVDFTHETLLKEWQGDDFTDVTYANIKTWGIWDGELEKNVSRTAGILSIEWIDDDDLYACDISMDNDTVTYSSTWAEGEAYDVYVAVYDADGHLLKLEMDKASGEIAAEGAAYARVYFWSKDMTGLRDVITASKGKIGDDISGE